MMTRTILWLRSEADDLHRDPTDKKQYPWRTMRRPPPPLAFQANIDMTDAQEANGVTTFALIVLFKLFFCSKETPMIINIVFVKPTH